MNYQNLDDGVIKKYLLYGRCWFSIFYAEWCIPSNSFGFHIRINYGDSNDRISFHISGLGISLFFDFKFFRFPFGHWSEYLGKPIFLHEEREFSLSVHSWGLWFYPFSNSRGSFGTNQKWYQNGFSFYPIDFLFGKNEYSEQLIEEGKTLIPMPEGSYEAAYKLYVSIWERPRIPFKKRAKRITINVPKGIPHEGKGENSWDCGEDATYGITCCADTVEEGIGKLVGYCLRNRKKYGGKIVHRQLNAVLA